MTTDSEHREQARAIAEQIMNQIAVGAWQFCSREWNIQNCAEALTTYASSRDAEIKEVLEGLRSYTGCWCNHPDSHAKYCLAARALYDKVNHVT